MPRCCGMIRSAQFLCDRVENSVPFCNVRHEHEGCGFVRRPHMQSVVEHIRAAQLASNTGAHRLP